MSTNPTVGRSRGRARVNVPPSSGMTGPSGTAPLPSSATTPLTTTTTLNVITQTPSPPAQTQTPSPPIAHPPMTGRGRGMTSVDSTISSGPVPTIISTTGGSVISSANTGSTSAKRMSPDGTPPDHSPTEPMTHAMGRAAMRGGQHQPAPPLGRPGELVPAMERLQVQEGGAGAQREARFEQVLFTKPDSCTEKRGTNGHPVKIFCNYFEVLNKPDWVLYQYHVDFQPEIESRRMRVALLNVHNSLFPSNKAFDGSTLYTLTKLDEMTEVASTRETDKQIIMIKIKRVGEIGPTSPQFVHLFNVVFKRCLKKYGYEQMGFDHFDNKNPIRIPEYNMDLINGFATSVGKYESKLLLCVELTHKLVHHSTILMLMQKIYRDCRGDGSEFKKQTLNAVVGRVVITKYNNKTYKIDDVNFDLTPKSQFDTKQGSISFLEYYQKNYSCVISDATQPLLVSLPSAKDKRRGQNTPILLVPELCCITGVDEFMRNDFKFKRTIDQHTKVGAQDRCARLTQFINRFNENDEVKGELARWQMTFNNQPAEIAGRVMETESIGFANGVVKRLNERADWSNDIKEQQLLSCVPLKNWVVIFPQTKKMTANNFVMTFGQVIRSMGIQAVTPKDVMIGRDDPMDITNALKQCIDENTQMVVVIVSSKRKDRYDAIKRVCCLEKPVPSQVVTSAIIDDEKKRKSVVTKVAIQMNCKLGGEIWKINIPMKNIMICGIDTYHDSAKKKGSVCAFIATTNEDKTRFFSRATLQETHQELSSNLTITVKSSIEHYYRCNNTYPARIIIYRDGVSDGQLPLVLEYEIPQIKKAFELVNPTYQPALGFIVVKKRGNSRFFHKGTQGPLSNPPCGTIIDSVVTREEWFDFYLISQYVTQGTVNPTHYNVVYDNTGLKPDHYQRMSYKLCHMYYNWPGTIRVPAVCQYAHKLAFLVGQSLHKEHHSLLADKLFYL